MIKPAQTLSHINSMGEANMVDVSEKKLSKRLAIATGKVLMQPSTLQMIMAGSLPKGDVLSVARTAGIMAAKQTDNIVPLCHHIPLDKISIIFEQHDVTDNDSESACIVITASASATWKTGVEMEALTAVTVSALTMYDMVKSADKGVTITDIKLLQKSGGKSEWLPKQ